MNRNHLLVVALVFSLALLVPTGAAPFDSLDADQPEGMENIELAPADGPNGDYAVLNDDGEIEILISDENPAVDSDGVSAGGTTILTGVFTITETGETGREVWITDGADAVQFIRDDGSSIEGHENRRDGRRGPQQLLDRGRHPGDPDGHAHRHRYGDRNVERGLG
ncbi:hypothetical protein BRC64_05225 [Halobacteriales archaeon QH_10_67_22]|nr:MAG: hypothetical protein BRC64_05225 [Halobacteriales archaeon QH_10_67_22]